MPTIEHIHTYVRAKKQRGTYKCRDPYCTHKALKIDIEGKVSRCTSCGEEIILTPEHLRRANPQCLECSNSKEARAFRERRDLLKEMGL